MVADTRRVVGSAVQAYACNVLGLQESSRKYGDDARTKKLDGIVEAYEFDRVPGTN